LLLGVSGGYCQTTLVDVSGIALRMEAVRISETSVYYNDTTWRNIPEGHDLYAGLCENLKSHEIKFIDTTIIFISLLL
jgi:hypothetical protein